ncbi:hypothetical protein HDU77_009854 [Chytriomyces hyalinus]|nr:hypothetical protein HDU77_009854 [Chytriomyces hyalinus]
MPRDRKKARPSDKRGPYQSQTSAPSSEQEEEYLARFTPKPGPLNFDTPPPPTIRIEDRATRTIETRQNIEGYRAWTEVMRARYPFYSAGPSPLNNEVSRFRKFHRLMKLDKVRVESRPFAISDAVPPRCFEMLLSWMGNPFSHFSAQEMRDLRAVSGGE